MNDKIEGIIYKVQEYKESSRLLFVYTKHGKITLNARGSQKLNSNTRVLAQYLNKISFMTNKKDFQNLNEPKLLNDYLEIKKDFNLTKMVNVCFEIISKTIIDDKYNEKIYNLLNEVLDHQETTVAILSFSLKMLYYLGYGMNLDSNGLEVIGFNISLGRVIYQGENYPLDLDLSMTILLLKLAHSKINSLEKINEHEIKVIKDFIYYYYIDKVDLPLKSIK